MFSTTIEPASEAVDVKTWVEGNRLVGADVFADGSVSCLRQNLGTYKSPEHAEVMAELMFNPRYTLFIAQGKVTEEFLDNVVAALRQQRVGG